MRLARPLVFVLATLAGAAQSLPTGATGFVLETGGTVTTDPQEVVAGTKSIKGSYTGNNSYTTYLRSDASFLPLEPTYAYRVTFRYKILATPNRGFEVLFYSPTGGAAGNFLPSYTFTGAAGDTGTATLTNTLGSYRDYHVRWNIVGRGAISIDDIELTDLAGRRVVGAENGEGPVLSLNATRVDLAGAPNPMVVGSTVELRAVARDAAGKVLTSLFGWSSSNANVLQVDQKGVLKAVGLGNARISVTSGRVRGNMDVTTVPLRVEIDPPSVNLLTGDRQKFTARALDAARQPISGGNLQWQVLSPNGGGTNTMTVDANGMLAASIEGRYTVQATVNGVRGFAPLQVDIKPLYRLTPVFSNDAIPGPHRFVLPATNAVFGDAGQFAFSANLNGWAQQVLLWENGQFVPLVAPGESDFGFARMRRPYNAGGINSRGEVLLTGADGIILAGRDRVTNLFPEGVWLGWAVNFGGFSTGPHAINETGEIAFYASRFQYAGSTTVLTGIFKLRGGRVQPIWTSDQPLEGISGTYTFQSNPQIDGAGNVYFRANYTVGATALFAYYRTDGSTDPKRLIALGDAVEGSTVNSMSSLAVNENGDAAYQYGLANGRVFLVRMTAAGTSETGPAPASMTPFTIDRSGRLLYRRQQNPSQGLYLREGSTDRPLILLNSTGWDGGTINTIDNAGFDAAGDVIAQIRTNRGGVALVKVGGDFLLKSGDTMELAATPLLATNDSLVRGSGLRLKLGSPGSLVEVRPTGFEPVVTVGDSLPDSTILGGVNRFIDNGPQGVYFANASFGNRFYRRTEAGYQALATTPGGINTFAVNSQGHAALVNNPRLQTTDGASLSLLADNTTAAPSGGTFVSFSQVALDDYDRVLAVATTSAGATGLFLYDGAWQTKIVYNETQVRGLTISGISSIRAVGRAFYALLQNPVGWSAVAKFQDGDWETEFAYGDALPFSPEMVNNINLFDVNAKGDLLFRVSGPGRSYVLFKPAGAPAKPVMHNAQPVEGSYINTVTNLILQDDGVVYLGGFNQSLRYLIIRGDAL